MKACGIRGAAWSAQLGTSSPCPPSAPKRALGAGYTARRRLHCLAGYQLMAVALDAPGQRQLEQGDLDRAGRQAGGAVRVRRCRRGPAPAPPAACRGRRPAIWGASRGGARRWPASAEGRPGGARNARSRAFAQHRRQRARGRPRVPSPCVAPDLSRALVPSARGSRGWPGTANTSRPCSPAMRAVINVPDRRAASTISTPSEMPEMMRLRRGKSWAARHEARRVLASPGSRARRSRAAGRHSPADRYCRCRRPPRRRCPSSSAASWAAASMPRARPDAMTKPARRVRGEQAGELLACRRAVARADDGDHRPRRDGRYCPSRRAAAAAHRRRPAPADSRARS